MRAGSQRASIHDEPLTLRLDRLRPLLAGAFAVVLGAPPAQAKETPAAPEMSAAAPAGFDAMEQPQTTLIDVYFGGDRITTAMATFTPRTLIFLKPSAVLAVIPHLKSNADLAIALAAPLAAHAGQACSDRTSDTCARLNPSVIGVVFDEARFRADLFVNPAYLDVDTPLRSRYLPEPQGPVSAVSVTSGVVSGSTGSHAAYGVQNRTIIAFKTVRLVSDIAQSYGGRFQAETLAAVADRQALRYEAGLLRTPGLEFFGEGHLVGVGVGTQLDTLLNRDLVTATPILVFLNQRSQVELYRAGRLVSSRTYDVGNQLIDTSALPDGSYEVVVRIRETGGQVREERRFFTRSRTLPPLGHPQYQLIAGALVRDPGDLGGPRSGSPYAQFSYARRLTRAFALDADVSLIGHDPVAALGATYVGRGVRLHTEAVEGGRAEHGVLLDAALSLSDHFSLAVNARRAWGRETRSLAAAVSELPFGAPAMTSVAPTIATRPNQGFVGPGEQISASLSYARRGVQLGLVGSYTSAAFTRASYAVGGSVEAPLAWRGLNDVRLYANAAETDRGLQASIGLRFRLARGRSGVFGDVGYAGAPRAFGQGTGPLAQLSANTAVDTRAGELATTGGYAHTPERDTAAVGAQLRGPFGDYGATLERDLGGVAADTRYSANFTMAAALAEGRPVIGAATSGDGGVVVRVRGDVDRASFRVLVNDAPVATVRAGSSVSVFLAPYRAYRIRLAPLGGAAVDFDTADRRISLYPGNMSALTWIAERDVEVFGRIVDERGEPVINALISGARAPSFTDGHGYFQASVLAGRDLSVRKPDGRNCRVALPAPHVVNGYAAVGVRACLAFGSSVTMAQR